MDPNETIALVHRLLDATREFLLIAEESRPPSRNHSGTPLWESAIRNGAQRLFIVLHREDEPEKFVGFSVDRSSGTLQTQLWISLWRRDDAEGWRQYIDENFSGVRCSFRTPRNPDALASSTFPELHYVNCFLENECT